MSSPSFILKPENIALSASWKEKGNVAHKESRPDDALEAYTQALLANPLNVIVFSNRAQVFLQKNMHGQAAADCIRLLESRELLSKLDPSVELKGRVRLAKACVELWDFDTAELHCTYLLHSGSEPFATAAREIQVSIAAAKKRQSEKHAEMMNKRVLESNNMSAKEMEDIIRAANLGVMIETRPTPYRRNPDSTLLKVNELVTNFPVTIQHGPNGFGVFAKTDLPAGTVVMVDPTFLCCHTDPNRCYHCLKPVADVRSQIRCTSPSCRRVFCSVNCKSVATSAYHAPFCGKDMSDLEAQIASGRTASSRFGLLAAKLLGMALQKRGLDGGGGFIPDTPVDLSPWNLLWRKTDNGKPFSYNTFLLRAWLIFRQILRDDRAAIFDPKLDLEWILQVYAVLVPNCVGMTNPDEDGILNAGQGLMLQGSFFNHSCVPNTDYHSNINEGSEIRFITKTGVKAGTELVITYVDPNLAFNVREAALHGQYGFHCYCPKCKREGRRCRKTWNE